MSKLLRISILVIIATVANTQIAQLPYTPTLIGQQTQVNPNQLDSGLSPDQYPDQASGISNNDIGKVEQTDDLLGVAQEKTIDGNVTTRTTIATMPNGNEIGIQKSYDSMDHKTIGLMVHDPNEPMDANTTKEKRLQSIKDQMTVLLNDSAYALNFEAQQMIDKTNGSCGNLSIDYRFTTFLHTMNIVQNIALTSYLIKLVLPEENFDCKAVTDNMKAYFYDVKALTNKLEGERTQYRDPESFEIASAFINNFAEKTDNCTRDKLTRALTEEANELYDSSIDIANQLSVKHCTTPNSMQEYTALLTTGRMFQVMSAYIIPKIEQLRNQDSKDVICIIAMQVNRYLPGSNYVTMDMSSQMNALLDSIKILNGHSLRTDKYSSRKCESQINEIVFGNICQKTDFAILKRNEPVASGHIHVVQAESMQISQSVLQSQLQAEQSPESTKISQSVLQSQLQAEISQLNA